MNHILRIAWREFTAIASTKAFWISLAMSPLIGLGFAVGMDRINESRPSRAIAVIDQTGNGDYASVIRRAIWIDELAAIIPVLRDHYFQYRDTTASTDAQLIHWLQDYRGAARGNIADEIEQAGGRDALIAAVREQLPAAPRPKLPSPRFRLVDLPLAFDDQTSDASITETLRPLLVSDKKDPAKPYAVVIIDSDANSQFGIRVRYWTNNLSDTSVSDYVQGALNRELERRQLLAHGIEPATLSAIQRNNLAIERFDVSKAATSARESPVDRALRIVPIVFAGLLMILVMMNLGFLLQSIMEEKSNRLLEILLSSVTPLQLMTDKLLGIAAVTGLIVVSWGVILGSFMFFAMDSGQAATSAAEAQARLQKSGVDSSTINAIIEVAVAALKLLPAFVFYLICGYLIYASAILAIGSLCASQQEANNFMAPIVLSLMLPLFLAPLIIRDPNGTVATVFTWIPFFTPMVMLARISSDPPLIDIIGSSALLLLTVVVVMWISVKVFRYGALHGQQPVKLGQLLRHFRRREN